MKRLAIITTIINKLATITQINGYHTNLGNNIFYFRDLDYEYGETGAISIIDSEEYSNDINLNKTKQLNLSIEAIAFSENTLLDSHNMLEDLENALSDESVGGLAIKATIESSEKSIQTAGKTAIKITLNYQIIYKDERIQQ